MAELSCTALMQRECSKVRRIGINFVKNSGTGRQRDMRCWEDGNRKSEGGRFSAKESTILPNAIALLCRLW